MSSVSQKGSIHIEHSKHNPIWRHQYNRDDELSGYRWMAWSKYVKVWTVWWKFWIMWWHLCSLKANCKFMHEHVKSHVNKVSP